MKMMNRVASVLHRVAQMCASRSWRVHQFLVAAGFDERRLDPELFAEVSKSGREANGTRVESLASHG